MQRYYSASSLVVSLMFLSAISLVFFTFHTNWFEKENMTQRIYRNYISQRLDMAEKIKEDPEKQCQNEKQETISYQVGTFYYSFHCQLNSLFVNIKKQNKKFISFENIEDWLDVDRFKSNIYFIRSLSELPISSEIEPKIVRTLQDIDERLTQDFYGIIITDHYFNFTDKKIYGTVYSSYPSNDPNRRNLSFKSQVIQRLNDKYTEWHYLPSSRNTQNATKTN